MIVEFNLLKQKKILLLLMVVEWIWDIQEHSQGALSKLL